MQDRTATGMNYYWRSFDTIVLLHSCNCNGKIKMTGWIFPALNHPVLGLKWRISAVLVGSAFLSERFPSNQPLPLARESPHAQASLSSTKQMMAASSKLGNYKCYLRGVVNFEMLASEMWKNESESWDTSHFEGYSVRIEMGYIGKLFSVCVKVLKWWLNGYSLL